MSKYLLRKPTSADFEFLRDVHHMTLKEHVLKIWGWDQTKQDDFFREDFESAQIQIIQAFSNDIGYLQLNLEKNILHIVNILILPEFQNRGLGSEIIRDLIAKSRIKSCMLKLGVFKINTRAIGLYKTLGFKVCGESKTHFMMQLQPDR